LNLGRLRSLEEPEEIRMFLKVTLYMFLCDYKINTINNAMFGISIRKLKKIKQNPSSIPYMVGSHHKKLLVWLKKKKVKYQQFYMV
jgi:hypothetical protein